MSTPLIAALIGATFVAIGWYVTWKLGERSRRRAAALQYLERQIGELYGPLLGLIMHSRTVSEVKKKLLKTGPDGETGEFRDGLDVDVARFFEQGYSFPLNKQIRELISSKMHLLDTTELPASFEAFFRHQAELECLYRLYVDLKVETHKEYHGTRITRTRWPNNFEEDVVTRLKQLRADHRWFLERVTGARK
jgi:hypothetical protein